eukprot:GFUD01014748.1.p1 GENE.GFUD01014748.1~~GFUD01014748.1.p1  ORF type:complete len:336 (-),score=120.53 GFUD01014748.1:44-1051(-)
MGDPYHRLDTPRTHQEYSMGDTMVYNEGRDTPILPIVQAQEDEEKLEFSNEIWKTCLTFLFLLSGMVATTVSLIITNESVPEDPSLPDAVLDQVTYWPAGVVVSETIMALAMLTAFITVMMHKHRIIILRRIFFIVGLMYFYRAITMSITVLPKPDQHWQCPKQNTTLTMQEVWSKLTRVARDGGISLGDKQQFCGDYIFSGHTMVLIIAYLIVKQYSPDGFYLLHWFSYFLFLTGISALLLGHGHYSIDVLLGYWVTTRVWAMYHTLSNTSMLKTRDRNNTLQTLWWWRVFIFLEVNVPGPLPQQYSFPVPGFVRRGVSRLWLGSRFEREGQDV